MGGAHLEALQPGGSAGGGHPGGPQLLTDAGADGAEQRSRFP